MNETPFREQTTPLMRPHQVEAMQDESRSLQATLNAPAHVAGAVQDRGDSMRALPLLAVSDNAAHGGLLFSVGYEFGAVPCPILDATVGGAEAEWHES